MSEPAAKLPPPSPVEDKAPAASGKGSPSSVAPVKRGAAAEVQPPPGVGKVDAKAAPAKESAPQDAAPKETAPKDKLPPKDKAKAKPAAAPVEKVAPVVGDASRQAPKPAGEKKAGKDKPPSKDKPTPNQGKPASAKGQGPSNEGDKGEPDTIAAPTGPAVMAPTAAHAMSAKLVRRARAVRFAIKLAVGVLLPTALATAYYGWVASDLYESTSLFTVQSADSRPSVGLEMLLVGAPTAAARDTLAVRDYILSRDMLARLDRDHQFISDYKDVSRDWLARLSADSSTEDAYQYYLKRVHVEHDVTSGVTTLRVKAFSPKRASEFAEAILASSEEMVNQLSERARADQIQFAQAELDVAEKRLAKARQHVLELQGEHAEFNPAESAQESLSIRGQLKAELAKVQAELAQARSYMAPTAPKVIALKQQAASLAGQIAGESRRLVNPKGESGLNASIATFEEAMIEKEFAQSAYHSALTSLEVARADAGRQHRYLARIAEPSTPDEATYPRRGLGILTVFVLALAIMGIGSLLLAAVREHARI